MALQDLLQLSAARELTESRGNLSVERLEAIKPVARQYIAFWREYPDMFVDFLQTGRAGGEVPASGLRFYFYQRVFLRAAMRYKYVYMTFTRAYSKSFLSILTLICRCILYPGAQLFVTAGGKEQASSIMQEKVAQLCRMIPALDKEIDRSRGKTKESKDYCKYIFKNGSSFDNVVARESARGLRRHAGLIEECVGVDGKILNEVLIPIMNVSRRCMDGTVQKDEVLNKSQIYITSAGYKGSFAYDKLIQFLMWMITEPDKVIVLGGTYRIPVLFGLLEQDFLKDLEKDETYNEASFSREYDSRWSGSAEDAFFDSDMISKNRILLKAENEYSGHTATENGHYILGVDVGRKGCDTVIAVIKVIPQAFGPYFKSLVQLYTLTDVHFAQQSIFIKKVFYKFKCTRAIIDANGIGIGLVDELVTNQTDPDTGDTLPGFGVYNDDEGYYKQYKTDTTELDALYLIKANAPINTAAHAYLKASLQSGKLKLLIDEKKAKTRLLGTKVGQKMTPEQRAEYLKPYTLTSIFSEELLNLREDNEGANIILKQVNRKIGKDKVSAIEYALYYVKEEEETKKKRKHFNIADLMLFN